MDINELQRKLHQYTEVEIFFRDHPELRSNAKAFHKYVSKLPAAVAEKYLFPLVDSYINPQETTFPVSYFFDSNNYDEITINQHTRYSPPVMHNHDFYELFFVYEGEFHQQINHQDLVMRTGDVCIIPPGIYHSLDVDNYSIVINVLIQKETFQNIFFNDLHGDNVLSNFYLQTVSSKALSNFVVFHTNGDLGLMKIFLEMYLEVLNQQKYYTKVVKSKLVVILVKLLRDYSDQVFNPAPQRQNETLELKIVSYIENHISNVSLDLLADHFHYSKQVLSQYVKNQSGLSFTKFIQRYRVQNAKQFLTQTDMKVKDIATAVGYSSSEHFIRLFKKETGKTPTEFRQGSK
ncbi:hypothetical protein IV64_GL002232 [Lactiplantibacillus xiangfangensis]|uniref:HTH araC/xylS-type domain-containing protein n=1 Tax=Lactiplantibacillus xiangfangensis TaxID=942150 RepID=A0A0R2MHG9_9LACO|nr:hypothetical protein IV64_GL002232 [Lactiplantibacillus xiangfangensis]